MRGAESRAWFVGDLGDPWVAAIAARLPAAVDRRDCPGEIPESWAVDEPTPTTLILHRPAITPTDALRLARLRSRGPVTTRVILCLGPYARHDDLVRAGRLFDVVIPEATAAETVARHLDPGPRSSGRRPPVRVVSALHDTRLLLADACRHAGYPAVVGRDPGEPVAEPIVVWDVPVLDPTWPGRLAVLGRSAAVVGLFGFADRAIVATARASGAAACLDWPSDLDDLIHVLDRLAQTRPDPPHPTPPAPAMARRSQPVDLADPGRST